MSFWCDFGAGWFGGVVGLVVGHPFDTLKVSFEPFGKLAAPKFQCVNDTTSWNALAGYFTLAVWGLGLLFMNRFFSLTEENLFSLVNHFRQGHPSTEPNRKLRTLRCAKISLNRWVQLEAINQFKPRLGAGRSHKPRTNRTEPKGALVPT